MAIRPVAITGTGLATCLGLTPAANWDAIFTGKSGWSDMSALETPAIDGKGGYQAVDLPVDFMPDAPREVRYLRYTIDAALADLGPMPYGPDRCGIVVGTTLHGMRSGGAFLRTGDFGHLRSFLAGSVLAQVVRGLPLSGDALTTCSACSSSLGSIALACTLLETRQLDLVVAGGYDAVSEYAWGGFNSLRLVADGSLKPFSKDRRGMKLGEGYGIVVLERDDDARRRNAKVIAAIAGWGESADAHHLTQPHPQGAGAAAAMTAAIDRAGCAGVDVIFAHATGTPDNDAGEAAAVSAVFGATTPVVGLKSHLGHTLGGAGAVELILAAVAMSRQTIPPTATADVEFPIAVNTTTKSATIARTINTSLGFGGANTCVVLAQNVPVIASQPNATARPIEVVVTGVGALLSESFTGADTGPIAEDRYLHLLNARRVRRLSDYVKLSLAATALAMRQAGYADVPPPSDFNVLLGTTHGSAAYCVDYYRQIVEGGFVAANPLLFAEGVPNAAAAHLSLTFGLKGACQTVIGGRTSGLDALRLAQLRIASGQWDRAVVGAAEEYLPLINDAYRHCGLYGPEGFATGSGAVSLILESRESADRRGAKILGIIGPGRAARFDDDPIPAIRSVLFDDSTVYSSGNRTWVERAEAAALGGDRSIVRGYDTLPELFSVGPLAAVVAAIGTSATILCTGYDGVTGSQRVRAPTAGTGS